MKKLNSLLLFILFTNLSIGQSVDLSSSFETSSNSNFKNANGLNLTYNLKSRENNRISFSFSYIYKNAQFCDNYINESDQGPTKPSYIFKTIDSKNQKLSLGINYSYKLIENPDFSLLIGANFNLNYFWLDKKIDWKIYYPYNNTFGMYNTNVKDNIWNKVALGLNLEFELKSVFAKELNLFTRINPQLMNYGSFEKIDGGRNEPWLTSWLKLDLGFRYLFNQE